MSWLPELHVSAAEACGLLTRWCHRNLLLDLSPPVLPPIQFPVGWNRIKWINLPPPGGSNFPERIRGLLFPKKIHVQERSGWNFKYAHNICLFRVSCLAISPHGTTRFPPLPISLQALPNWMTFNNPGKRASEGAWGLRVKVFLEKFQSPVNPARNLPVGLTISAAFHRRRISKFGSETQIRTFKKYYGKLYKFRKFWKQTEIPFAFNLKSPLVYGSDRTRSYQLIDRQMEGTTSEFWICKRENP